MSTASDESKNEITTTPLQMTVEAILAFVFVALFGLFALYLVVNLLWRRYKGKPLVVNDPESPDTNRIKMIAIITTIGVSGAAGVVLFYLMKNQSEALFNGKIDEVKATNFECYIERSGTYDECDDDGICEPVGYCDEDPCLHASNDAKECSDTYGGADAHGGNPQTKAQQLNLLEQERDEVKNGFIIYSVFFGLAVVGVMALFYFYFDTLTGKSTATSTTSTDEEN